MLEVSGLRHLVFKFIRVSAWRNASVGLVRGMLTPGQDASLNNHAKQIRKGSR